MSGDKARHHAGQMAHHGGVSAELSVERHYARRGHVLLARRWRGSSGEIDLVFRSDAGFVFVEVKKSRSFAMAARRVSDAQKRRILAAASEFVAGEPEGQLSPMRFDVALCDATGAIEILENALFCE
jgi:putative endonuclease